MPTYAQLLKDFRELDFDGDGIIDAEEFLAILQRDGENGDLDVGTAGMMLKSIARHADGKFDKDGDGQVSVEELAAALADEPDNPDEDMPTLQEVCAAFEERLGLDKGLDLKHCLDAAAAKLGLNPDEYGLHDLAKQCWLKLHAQDQRV